MTDAARAHLSLLLVCLAGEVFEPAEADAAREAVRVVNHLVAILQSAVRYEAQDVTLKCTFQKGNGRPMFHLRRRGGSEQETVYAKKAFPAVSLRPHGGETDFSRD